jgi:hypothetical protein
MGGSLMFCVPDVDAAHDRAVAAVATSGVKNGIVSFCLRLGRKADKSALNYVQFKHAEPPREGGDGDLV